MKREILLRHEATAIAAKNGLAGLLEYAEHLHEDKSIKHEAAVIDMVHSDDPTTATGFYFNSACGEGGIIMATVGASYQENGLEGVRFLFNPEEAAAAQAALLSELHGMEADTASAARPAFTVV